MSLPGPSAQQTIYALASASGKAGVSVVRISGPKSYAILELLLNKPDHAIQAREAFVAPLYHPKDKSILDKALCLYFKNPGSFTGEDVAELHLHGSPAILERVFGVLEGLDNVRMAEPGEFSKRAYLNGKIDLTEAEAIADLVAAETQAQAEQALYQMQGGLRRLYDGWHDSLLKALAYIEADIDFSDEEIPESMAERMKPVVEKIGHEIRDHLNDDNRGEILRTGFRIAVFGAPNVGKSSLVNALAQRDIAIVSDSAGTTRDILECHLNIGGYPVILTDTAGLRDAEDSVEKIGIDRAIRHIDEADFKLALFDASHYPAHDPKTINNLDENTLCFINKTDITPLDEATYKKEPFVQTRGVIFGSVTENKGLDDLIKAINKELKNRFHQKKTATPTRSRHRKTLQEAQKFLEEAILAKETELIAENVRLAMRAIGRLSGRVDVEDLLDVIFKDFCIGK